MGRRSGSGCPLKKPGYLSTRCVQGGCHLMRFFALRLLLHSCRRRPFGCRCFLRCRPIRSHGGCSLSRAISVCAASRSAFICRSESHSASPPSPPAPLLPLPELPPSPQLPLEASQTGLSQHALRTGRPSPDEVIRAPPPSVQLPLEASCCESLPLILTVADGGEKRSDSAPHPHCLLSLTAAERALHLAASRHRREARCRHRHRPIRSSSSCGLRGGRRPTPGCTCWLRLVTGFTVPFCGEPCSLLIRNLQGCIRLRKLSCGPAPHLSAEAER